MATALDNFRATIAHRRPAQILYHADYVDDLRRRLVEHIGTENIDRHYGCDGSAWVGARRPDGWQKPDFSKYWAGENLPPGTRINEAGVAAVPSGFYHFWGYVSPLRNAKSLKELEDYPLVEYDRFDYSGMKAEVDKAHAEGKIVYGSVGHMYETAWQIRGYTQFLVDTVEQPAWAECLLERLFRQNLVKAREAARAGVDILSCGDDVANQRTLMFRKDTWARLIHSRWAQVWAEARSVNPDAQVFYHSDGNIIDIVPELVDAGVRILNPLQPECLDIDAVYRRFGRHITLDGTMGTQSTMPWGKPADVRARVREVIDKYGRDGGLIIAPTHVLEPEVPLENIDAFFDACREYGNFE